MKAVQLPFHFSPVILLFPPALLREVVQGGGGVGFLLFVVVTAPNLICNGYQLVGVFTIANGENKSVFATFIISLTFK